MNGPVFSAIGVIGLQSLSRQSMVQNFKKAFSREESILLGEVLLMYVGHSKYFSTAGIVWMTPCNPKSKEAILKLK